MKITVDAKKLNSSYARAAKYAPRTSTLPAIQTVCLEAKADGTLALYATDTERSAIINTDGGQVKEPGVILLTRAAGNALGLSSGTVEISSTPDGHVTILTTNAQWVTESLHPDEYPRITRPNQDGWKPIDGKTLADAVKRVAFAAGKDDNRPALTCVHVANGYVEATDGFRIARQAALHDLPNLLIPHLPAVLADIKNPTMYWLDESRMLWLSDDNISVGLTLLENKYPNTDDVIPKKAGGTITCLSGDLQDAIRKTSLVSSMAVTITANDDGLALTSQDAGVGSSEVKIKAEVSQEITFRVNPMFLTDALRQVAGKVSIGYTDNVHPFVVSSPEDDTWFCVIMPMHMQ